MNEPDMFDVLTALYNRAQNQPLRGIYIADDLWQAHLRTRVTPYAIRWEEPSDKERRLFSHRVLRRLKRAEVNGLVERSGDGSGLGYRWKLTPAALKIAEGFSQ